MYKIIESRGFFGKNLGNGIGKLGKKALLGFAIFLTKNVLLKLANKVTLSLLDKVKSTIKEQGVVRGGRRFTLFISNEDIDDFIKIVSSLEDSDLLFDSATEIVKHEMK